MGMAVGTVMIVLVMALPVRAKPNQSRTFAITPYPRCGYLLPSQNSSQATLSLRYRPPLLGFWHEAD
jgi:hypothetical protein